MSRRPVIWLSVVVSALLACLVAPGSAWGLGDEPVMGETVTQYLTPAILQSLFPGAEKIGDVGGTPPSAPVSKAGRTIGYVFSTWDVTRSRGFSNRPIVLLVGLDLAGRITGAKLVHHTEPIGILGLHDADFFRFTDQFTGYDIKNGVDVVIQLTSSPLGQGSFSQRAMPGEAATVKVDATSRATTSSVLMSDAVVRGARIVARSRGILPTAGRRPVVLDIDRFAAADWPALEASGALAHLHLTYNDVLGKLREHGARRITGADDSAGPDDPLVDVYVALLTPAGIGINILDKTWYDQYTAGRGIDDQLLLVAANGTYSVLGDDWEHADKLERIELVQGDKTIPLSGKQIKTLPFLHAKGGPDLTERALVFLQGNSDFDPAQPWQLRLLVAGESRDGKPSFADFAIPYKTPDIYLVKRAAAAPEAMAAESGLAWTAVWWAHDVKIAILGTALIALTAILFLQAWISRRRRLHRFIRIAFLTWTLVWLGWYAGAQLTVVQVITWIHSLVTDFRWDYLLADPLITILLGFTLVAMLFWGRAAFCGWLCPFGALQELVNKAARGLRVPQLKISPTLNGWLVVGKYVLFVALVAVSFWSLDLAMTGAEIEPFKAAIILRFMTEWPMVLYAAALVVLSLFVERFYCRFVCPLGGGLAIFGKVRVFNSLKRHSECGSRCRFCESVCPVGAIKRNGQINMNECFYCLDCQVAYYDDHICPPMVWRRKLLERGAGEPRLSGGVAMRTARR